MNGIERPLDLLNKLKGHNVKIRLKNKEEALEGVLLAFDLFINVCIELTNTKQMFIKGDIIETIVPKEGREYGGNKNKKH